jgi:hypothetical protein
MCQRRRRRCISSLLNNLRAADRGLCAAAAADRGIYTAAASADRWICAVVAAAAAMLITHFRSHDVNSCDVTFRHVTSGSHATYGHTQWYILYYYYGKKKAREYAEHTPGYDVIFFMEYL